MQERVRKSQKKLEKEEKKEEKKKGKTKKGTKEEEEDIHFLECSLQSRVNDDQKKKRMKVNIEEV